MSIESLLVRQAGVISRRQALTLGMSGDAVDRRISGRRWRPLHPRVYLTEGQRLTAEARVRAAMLWAGEGAVLSGLAAAWWWGLVADAPPVVSITVPRRRNPGSHRGVRIRRRALAPPDLDAVRDVAVVARPLAVLEAAVELGDAGGAFLDRALQRHVPFALVYSAYTRFVGAHGATRAHALIVAAADGSAAAAGRRLVGVLRQARITGWTQDLRVDGFSLDVAFPAARVAIEVDGWARHMDAVRAAHDKRRRNALLGRGWTVLRCTWHDIVGRPEQVVGEITQALRRSRSA